MKKISEWLSGFDGHAAMDAELCQASFEKETGSEWPKSLMGRPVKQLLAEGKKNYKGLQSWDGKAEARVLAGYQVAEALTDKLLKGFYPRCEGRGSRFRECVEALEKAGL